MDTADSYTKIAEEYAKRIFHELENKPKDRELLDQFSDLVREQGPVCDLGCGPGHIARYLDERGVQAFGMDLSVGMCEQARRLSPQIRFQQGDMLATGLEDESLAGVAALYSIIHIPREQVVVALKEINRVLKSGGHLFLSHHIGEQIVHVDELWGVHELSLDFIFFTPNEMAEYLRLAGFEIKARVERPPYAEGGEAQTHRAYFLAQK